jgi:hypothetical protein
VGFRYTLRLADGTDAGEVEYADTTIATGDVIRVDGNHKMLVRAVVPIEWSAEFVDGAVCGVLEVEPYGVPCS